MSNFELISKTVVEWNKKKPLPILDKMSRASSEMYLHTIGLENQEWY